MQGKAEPVNSGYTQQIRPPTPSWTAAAPPKQTFEAVPLRNSDTVKKAPATPPVVHYSPLSKKAI